MGVGLLRSLASPYYVDGKYYMRDNMFLRLDIKAFDFSENQLFECAQNFEAFMMDRVAGSFLLRCVDMDGKAARKRSFVSICSDELQSIEADDFRKCGLCFYGFLKTPDMQKKADMDIPWKRAAKTGQTFNEAYSLGSKPERLLFPQLPDQEEIENNPETMQEYMKAVSSFSQENKRWLAACPDWDVKGSFSASFQEYNGKIWSRANLDFCLSCYMLEGNYIEPYNIMREYVEELNHILPFLHATIGFGPSNISTYELICKASIPEDMNNYEYYRQHGELLGFYNRFPKEWGDRLSHDIPDVIKQENASNDSVIVQIDGEVTPHRIKDYLALRKYLKQILVPMGESTVYFVERGPHIAPFEPTEITLKKHSISGEYYPVFKWEQKGNGSFAQ